MASSSSSPKPHKIYQIIKLNGNHDHVQQVDQEKAKAEERDLLELRLGRGFGLTSKNLYMGPSSCSSFSLQQPKQQHVGIDLGLGLGCYPTADRNHALPCSVPSVPSSMPFRLRPQPGLWFSLHSSPNRYVG